MGINQIILYFGALSLLSLYVGLPFLAVVLTILMLVSIVISFLVIKLKKGKKWSSTNFLNKVFPLIEEELNWDSLWGNLENTVSQAKTYSGVTVFVAVCDDLSKLKDVLADAEVEKNNANLPVETPLWLYIPETHVNDLSPENSGVSVLGMEHVVLKPVIV